MSPYWEQFISNQLHTKTKKWRILDIRLPKSSGIGFWEIFWGADVFINNFPILKIFMLINIIFWIAMILLK